MIVWAVFVCAFVCIQLVSKRMTGKYLSNYLWDATKRYPWFKWLVLIVCIGFTTHLVWGWP